MTIYSPRGKNNKVALPFGTSLYDLKQTQMPSVADLTVKDGLRLFSPSAAMVRLREDFFASHPAEAKLVLAGVRDPSDLLRRLVDGGRSIAAGRLAGAFRRAGRPGAADEIVAAMKAAGYDVREADPFPRRQALAPVPVAAAPVVGRIEAMWKSMREHVLEVFPTPPGLPHDAAAYLRFVEEMYRSDAYYSLSIAGYAVSPALIEQVSAGNWDPQDRDALAARGYWQAFQRVKADVGEILSGTNPGRLVWNAHHDWVRALFQPWVEAGLHAPPALVGYRDEAVYLRTSRYAPPRWEPVRDAMPALFDLIDTEPEPAVRAVLGHWFFGYVRPYPDGNGRLARFLMNAMLASGGYPWTVVRMGDRSAYLAALDRASFDMEIRPLARFLAERVGWSMEASPPG